MGDFLPERLKQLRGARSKSAFARELGLTPQVYQRYEDGRPPSGDNLSTICHHCSVSAGWLFGLTDKMSPEPASPADISGPSAVREEPEPYGRAEPICLFRDQRPSMPYIDRDVIENALKRATVARDWPAVATLAHELEIRDRDGPEEQGAAAG